MEFNADTLIEFLNHAISLENDLPGNEQSYAIQLGKNYSLEDFTIKASLGTSGRAAQVAWISFLKYEQTVQKGIYPVFLYYRKRKILILAYGVSETYSPEKTWDINTDKTIGQYFNGEEKKYSTSYVFKDYLIKPNQENKITLDDFNATMAIEDLKNLLDIYKRLFEDDSTHVVKPIMQISEKNGIMKENSEIQLVNMQKIFFGAPGTGKSFKVNQIAPKDDKVTFRTTFHPDYDYAQFVGSYKPKKENGTITYAFVPQVFAKAYRRAKETSETVYLVIEEINRGNCAQIFGDIFQLLDRNESGESQYEIDVDSDFAEWLGESKIKLPANFNILATMNTSDQSLFPMDSAFKRRFDWEYVPIRYVKDSKCGDNWNADGFEIKLDEHTSFSWLHFLKKINADIYKVTESEDKQMGEFFVKPKDGVIDLDMFRSKVLFYLWDSVYKDEPDKKAVFHFNYPEKNGSRVTFQSLFGDDANAIEIIKQMMKNLDKAYESKDDSEFKNFKIVSEQ